MNRRLVVVFGFALLVAGLTSFLLYRLIVTHVQAPTKATAATNKLAVAAHDLQVGALIHDYDVKEIQWEQALPPQAVAKKQDVIGRGVIANIYQDEPILNTRLAAKGAGAGLAATIPLGKRAVALRVDEVVGLAGFVLPGMRVDVLVAGNPPNGDQSRQGMLSRTVLQNIEVLSAGQKIEKTTDGKPETAQVVNLLVTPDQAEVLNLASIETKVQLVLRNPLDTEEEPTPGTSIARLFGAPLEPEKPTVLGEPFKISLRHAPVAPPEQQETTVEVYNGTKKTEEKVQMPQEKK
ncbi:MAG: Flp pilus assembly protein CpaB [Acidobacteriaceae bacterium]|nr:Flp pilus assembly protein CpaB [Acidobacteriaceae bacterium]MBV9778487.1 Flp pilus assembly protein CpaB [Acidobacteriaceae bacterium]